MGRAAEHMAQDGSVHGAVQRMGCAEQYRQYRVDKAVQQGPVIEAGPSAILKPAMPLASWRAM